MKSAFIVAIAVLVTLIIEIFILPHNTSTQHSRETAYDRVMRTGVLRCAYGLWDPCVMRDPNTGKFSGIIYDFMQDLGKSINVKCDYVTEVPWDSIGVSLQT
jgi:ABC-type amino acid transport substrate-binding protein